MTSVWLKHSTLALLLLPLTATGQVGGGEWIIDGTEHCQNGVLTVGTDIRIVAGGALVLEGCTLQMDVPPYDAQWLEANEEGLVIRVEEGGRLAMLAAGDSPAAIVATDNRHGFRVEVRGVLASDGDADTKNLIRDLEGSMAESFIGAGLQAIGNGSVYLNHTRLEDLRGPALFAWGGGHGYVRQSIVYNASGAFAAIDGTLTIQDTSANTGIEILRATGSRVALSGFEGRTNRIGIHMTGSDLKMDDVWINAGAAAVSMRNSDAHITGCRLDHRGTGLIHLGPASQARTVFLDACTVEGLGASASKGMHIEHADLRVQASQVLNSTATGIAFAGGVLSFSDLVFAGLGEADVVAANPMAIEATSVHATPGLHQPFRLFYSVTVTVIGPDGAAVQGAMVTMDGQNQTTDAQGVATLVWEPTVDRSFAPPTHSNRIKVVVGGETRTYDIDGQTRDIIVDLAARSAEAPAFESFALLVFGALILARRRRG